MQSNIADNLQKIQQQLGKTQLIAVSKTHPVSTLEEAYEAGCRVFGENKVQEMVQKYEALPKDIQWHLIGHLQTNKVKYIAPFVHLIHSVDSLKLLQEINKQGLKNQRVINCLLQIHIAQEETKFGFSFEEAEALLSPTLPTDLPAVKIVGCMGMATNTNDAAQVRQEFAALRHFFLEQKARLGATFSELSMGMSQDYAIAIAEGSTMVRIGSAIFGVRS